MNFSRLILHWHEHQWSKACLWNIPNSTCGRQRAIPTQDWIKLQYKTGCQPCHHPKLSKCTLLLSHWHMKPLKGQEFSWLYINTIHLFRVEKSTTKVRNKKIKSVSPSSQPKSLQLPPGNYLRNKQVLIHISAVGREFCIAASTVPTVLTTAQLFHPVLHWHKPKEKLRNRTWPHQQGCGQLRGIMVQNTVPGTSLGGVHWRTTAHTNSFLLNL